ncbi:MAG: hypothetical protein ACFE8N_09400, partial [Promethearchaeota archaeon]
MVDKLWYKVARLIVKSGVFPFPVSEALIELLQELITEEQAKFLLKSFKKPSLTLEQIKENSGMDETSILEMLDVLMHNGIIIGTKSKKSGLRIYRLMGTYPGIFEYTNLRGETDEKHIKLARMFQKLFSERRGMNEENYETMINTFKNFPPTDRTLPVEKEVELGTETVIPIEEIKKYVEEYD